jgi:CheY-like chemotaxis protein
VTTASDGEEAGPIFVRTYEEGGVDLVVSDVVMPTMDGPAMAREIRAHRPELPFLFMSGYAEETLREIDIPNMHFRPSRSRSNRSFRRWKTCCAEPQAPETRARVELSRSIPSSAPAFLAGVGIRGFLFVPPRLRGLVRSGGENPNVLSGCYSLLPIWPRNLCSPYPYRNQ